MPKSAKSDSFWRSRLKDYATGKFKFGQGQRPPPNSKWSPVIQQIDKCPLKGNVSKRDILGRILTCTCSFHNKDENVNEATQIAERSQPNLQKPQSSQAENVGEATHMQNRESHTQNAVSADTVSCSGFTIRASEEQSSSQHAVSIDEAFSVGSAVAASGQQSSLQHAISADGASGSGPVNPVVVSGQQPSSQHEHEKTRYDFSSRLPSGWRDTLQLNDMAWIGQQLFVSKGVLASKLKLWWHPPSPPGPEHKGCPAPTAYFYRRLFLWMPRKMWAFDYKCPLCKSVTCLTSKGIYNRVRSVIDVRDRYYLAAEYLECRLCKGTFIAYDSRLQDQLPFALRIRFPIILTRKFACDQSVVALMKARTQGNSPSAICNDIRELHTEDWMTKTVAYLSDCERHRKSRQQMMLSFSPYETPPPFASPPTAKWFLATYVRDVWSRLDTLKASATSVYGTILKIDSTKKITKKLQGKSANSASWCTNVGNERGEVLLSLLTTSESLSNLNRMADGLMDRYLKAGQSPPLVLYTDRDCCKLNDLSKFQKLFHRWDGLSVRLDAWHFMRRLSKACTNESHPLYGTFMAKISACIFEWDSGDMLQLKNAKRSELQSAGVRNPSDAAVSRAITKMELARHCRRQTRGVVSTVRLLENLFLAFITSTDTLGVPLLREEALDVWNAEKKHVACLQDPEGVTLYTKTGEVAKGNVSLPVYRCARGTTSLESFHSHLKHFIPGSSANDIHFQAYLIEGLCRWNAARCSASSTTQLPNTRSFNVQLRDRLNHLSKSVLGNPFDSHYRPPSVYTGELFGVEYLHSETGASQVLDIDKEIEDGMDGDEDIYPDNSSCSEKELDSELEMACNLIAEPDDSPNVASIESSERENYQASVDSRSIEGWDKVDLLAETLMRHEGLSISNEEVEIVIRHYEQLSEFDKAPLTYSRTIKPSRGRFGLSKENSAGHVGQDAMRRCFVSAGTPALPPSKSRVVEALCIRLFNKITAASRTPYVSRYTLIIQKYNEIKNRIMLNPTIVDRTRLALFTINETTLSLWYKNKSRIEEIKLLLQGCNLPVPEMCAATSLPQARDQQPLNLEPVNAVEFIDPEDTTGQAIIRRRSKPQASTTEVPVFQEEQLDSVASALDPTTIEVEEPEQTEADVTISRTTAWRRRKAAATASASVASQGPQGNIVANPLPSVSRTSEWRKRKAEAHASAPILEKEKKTRKEYSCRVCNKPMSSEGHTQFRGSRYCPLNNPLSKEEWLAEKRRGAPK